MTTLDSEMLQSPEVQVVAMVKRNREQGARKELEKRDHEFVDGAVQFVRSQLAAVVELDSVRKAFFWCCPTISMCVVRRRACARAVTSVACHVMIWLALFCVFR